MTDGLDAAVQNILDANPGMFTPVDGFNKVHCSVSGHDVPLRAAALVAHMKTGKYLHALDRQRLDGIIASARPHIVPHRHLKGKLFCTLTGKPLNRRSDEVSRHISAKKYTRLHALWTADQLAVQERASAGEQTNGERAAGTGAGDVAMEMDDEPADGATDFWVPSGVQGSDGESEAEGQGDGPEPRGIFSDSDNDDDDGGKKAGATNKFKERMEKRRNPDAPPPPHKRTKQRHH